MSDIKLGNVPSSTLSDTSNFIFADGENVRKETYANVKADIVGSANLTTTAQKTKEAINELNQDLLESTGYGVISGGIVSAQSTPNMTVQVTQCTLKTSTGARQVATANASLAIAGADTTNPRIDIIYVGSTGATSYLIGTPSASPTAPTTPTGGFLLYEINVVANTSSITNSDIVDKRKIKNTTDLLASELSDVAHKTGTVQTNLNADMVDGIQGTQIPLKTTANITYYINVNTGLDTNDGLTSGSAFKTIQYAIDKLPQIINHNVTIVLASGTYSEDINVIGFSGKGSITINGDTTTTNNYNVNSININSCSVAVTIKWINFTTTTKQSAMFAGTCSYVMFYYCNSTSVNAIGINASTSNVYANYCTISSKTSYGIITYCGRISSLANSGSNNAIALYASYAGTIGKSGTQPSGTTAEVQTEGGVIR